MKVRSTIYIERDGAEIAAQITGNYHPGMKGVKAHPMDRFAPPDDEPTIEDIEAIGPDGLLELTEEEYDQAHEKLMGAGAEARAYDFEARAESIRARDDDRDDYPHLQ